MKRVFLYTILFVVFSCSSLTSFQAAAQSKIEQVLNESEAKKFTKADKLISKGDEIMDKTIGIEKEIEALRNAEGRIKTRKIDKKSKTSAKYKMQASIFYKDGYNAKIKVLSKRLKEAGKSGDTEAKKVLDEVKGLDKKARKQYNKAENLVSYEEAVEMVDLAQSNQQEAIDIMSKAIIASSGGADVVEEPQEEVIEEIPVVIQDSIPEAPLDSLSTDSLKSQTADQLIPEASSEAATGSPVGTETAVLATGTTTAALVAASGEESAEAEQVASEQTAEEVPAELETPIVDDNPDVFFTIQLLAGKTKISEEKLKQTYSGSKKIIEMQGDGWYRYSIGKFNSIEKARQTQKAEGVKGFIVAYKDGQRISVKEAAEILK